MMNFYKSAEQSGRSMIEMLGVLAIIGVLSVGGIAGYSKAMTKFKINKTIDEVSQLIANTRTLYGSQTSYLNINKEIAKKAHLAPDEVFDSNGNMKNPFEGDLTIENAAKSATGDNKAFLVTLKNVTEDACMELATLDWGASVGSGLIAVAVNDSGATLIKTKAFYNSTSNDTKTSNYIATSADGTVPLTVAKAATACSLNSNTIYFKAY
jgi:type II secretory pathway pseudopilin PulG